MIATVLAQGDARASALSREMAPARRPARPAARAARRRRVGRGLRLAARPTRRGPGRDPPRRSPGRWPAGRSPRRFCSSSPRTIPPSPRPCSARALLDRDQWLDLLPAIEPDRARLAPPPPRPRPRRGAGARELRLQRLRSFRNGRGRGGRSGRAAVRRRSRARRRSATWSPASRRSAGRREVAPAALPRAGDAIRDRRLPLGGRPRRHHPLGRGRAARAADRPEHRLDRRPRPVRS